MEFPEGTTRKTLQLASSEKIDIIGISNTMRPRMTIKAIIHRENLSQTKVNLLSRLVTPQEVGYFQNDGILPYMIRSLLKNI